MEAPGFNRLSQGEQFVFKWQYRLLGDFGKALAECFARADDVNFTLLEKAYPVQGEAMRNFYRVSGWWQAIEEVYGYGENRF